MNDLVHLDSTQVPFIKVHLKNGGVSILQNWQVYAEQDCLKGIGIEWDYNREVKYEGDLAYVFDEVTLLETNNYSVLQSLDQSRFSALALITGVNMALTIMCATNPKACWGSCPTFFIGNNNKLLETRAEGFSSAITPSMEMKDIDALRTVTTESYLNLIMTNEALETHVVNQLSLLAVKTAQHESAFVDQDNRFYTAEHPMSPSSVSVNDHNILPQLCASDGIEYFSESDHDDLSVKEEIIMRFNTNSSAPKGIVLQYRQTLLTTFLLYTGYSYMGNEVGDFLSQIERDESKRKMVSKPYELLGGIEISYYCLKNKKWKKVDEIYETGPIASNQVLVPLPDNMIIGDDLHLKINMTRGLWRLDYIGLSHNIVEADAEIVHPCACLSYDKSMDKELLSLVCDNDADYLVSLPGERYHFVFELPALPAEYSNTVFLLSKGYYLEWIRSEWMQYKDHKRLKRMLMNHAGEWKALAREFKLVEDDMERAFWNSRLRESFK
ncbi:hypothetical protein [Carboxylicivirga marina]|uniref:Uncharacterized protein n=1 Tax=Carboxylicivirga marina TaxID=2800988 RepID=A0ABS1HM76_9BACT|nr:hypothetical protein [Carboxylicivirga marina]MBK3518647.1 hypothetical protein [Carboxylicivirga marina]